jgi:ABC-2 type transport system permease protein
VTGVLAAIWIFGAGVAILYALFVLVLSMAFLFVKIDNLSYLDGVDLRRGALAGDHLPRRAGAAVHLRHPAAVMTTYPSLALLGRIGWSRFATATVVAAAFLALSRYAWVRAIRRYSSAGG